MATHSSILAWRIAWTEEPGGRESTGLHSIRHDQATAHRQHDVKTDLTHVCRVTNTLASVSKTGLTDVCRVTNTLASVSKTGLTDVCRVTNTLASVSKTDLTDVCRVTNTLASVSKTEAQARLSLFRPCKLLPVGL